MKIKYIDGIFFLYYNFICNGEDNKIQKESDKLEEKSYKQVTLRGNVTFCFVNSNVSTYQGKETGYSLNLILDEDSKRLAEETANEILDVAQSPDWEYEKGKKVPKGYWNTKTMLINKLFKHDSEGNTYIVCKAKHLDKDGNRIYIPIFDRFGEIPKEKAKEISIFSGSTVEVEVTMYVYYLPSGMQGVKAKLRSIQILEENKGTGKPIGSSYKFDQQKIDEEVPI